MVKKYVSILEITNLLKPELMKRQVTIPISFPSYDTIQRMRVKGDYTLFEIQEAKEEREETKTDLPADHPLYQLRQELTKQKEGTENLKDIRIVKELAEIGFIESAYYSGTGSHARGDWMTGYEMPYILETEYIRQSDFPFDETELAFIDQMAVLYVFECQKLFDKNFGERLPMEFLEAESHIYELDIEKEPEKVGSIMQDLYKNCKPMEISYASYWGKFQGKWCVVPKSSIDLLHGCNILCDGSSRRHINKSLALLSLGLPLFLAFFLLEMGTEEFSSITYRDISEWKETLPVILVSDANETQNHHYSSFLYGFYSIFYQGVVVEGEEESFFEKVFVHMKKKMEKAAENNIVVLSTRESRLLESGEFKKASIFLENETLNWDEAEV